MSDCQTISVLKFGGASVANTDQFALIAKIISQKLKTNHKIVVVISAMGDTTNQLIEMAKKVNKDPPRREYDMLVSTGERISISLLAMALSLINVEAVSFTGSQSGIITCDNHTEARIVNVKPYRLMPVLEQGKVAIVAGFQGVSLKGEITTLGRGGSDTTAVALGVALKADKIEFFKDVPGFYSEDPKKNPKAELYRELSYEKAMCIIGNGAKVLHGRCVELARKNSMPLIVRSFMDFDPHVITQGTLIRDALAVKPILPIFE